MAKELTQEEKEHETLKTEKQRIYNNRELSWLEFNERILDMADNSKLPILERLNFLDIYQRNLDEFFKVRVGELFNDIYYGYPKKTDICEMYPSEQIKEIYKKVNDLETHRGFVDIIVTSEIHQLLGINFVSNHMYITNELKSHPWFKNEFTHFIKDFLSPHVVGYKEPFPFLADKEVYIITLMQSKSTGKTRIGIIPIDVTGEKKYIQLGQHENIVIPMEEYIIHYVEEVFPEYEITEKTCLRITRNSDVVLTNDIMDDSEMDVVKAVVDVVKLRKVMDPVRIEINHEISKKFKRKIYKHLKLRKYKTIFVNGFFTYGLIKDYINKYYKNTPEMATFRFKKIPDTYMADSENMKDLDTSLTIKKYALSEWMKHPVLFEYPFDSMSGIFDTLVRESDKINAINITIYRIDEKLIQYLETLSMKGVLVTVIVEARARFDELNNVNLISRLCAARCDVIMIAGGLKVHSKIMMINLKDSENLSYIGTGNFNVSTSKVYRDYAYITPDPDICCSVRQVIDELIKGCIQMDIVNPYDTGTRYYWVNMNPFGTLVKDKKSDYPNIGLFDFPKIPDLKVMNTKKLLVSPLTLRESIMNNIFKQKVKGRKGYILMKVNSLTDERIINALRDAALDNCKIDLIVRGACCLKVEGVNGLNSIRLVSVVGPLLEHHRVFIFGNDKDRKVYIGSSDMMPRNLERRVETVIQIEDEASIKSITDTMNWYMDVKAGFEESNNVFHRIIESPSEYNHNLIFEECIEEKK